MNAVHVNSRFSRKTPYMVSLGAIRSLISVEKDTAWELLVATSTEACIHCPTVGQNDRRHLLGYLLPSQINHVP